MLTLLTLQSLGGKHTNGIEETGAVADKISSKLAQAKTGSQRRYVNAILLHAHCFVLLIL